MSNRVVARFRNSDDALGAIDDLRRMDIASEAITLGSPEPIMHRDQNELGKKSRVGIFAIAGGFMGAFAALGLTIGTSRSMGLTTGGMPIVAPWPFGIIVFELTALGAILATFGRTLFEAGLLHRIPPGLGAESPGNGAFVLVVHCPTPSRAHAVTRTCQMRRGAVATESD